MPGFSSARAEIQDELGTEMPDVPISERNLPLFAKPQGLRALFAVATAHAEDRRLLRTLLFTGMRLSEALALKGTDADLDKKLIQIPGSRTVFLDAHTAELLRQAGCQGDEPLFHSGPEEFTLRLETYAQAAGLDALYAGANRRFTWRALRHAFGKAAADGGMNVMTLHKLLGHQFVQTTIMYVRGSMASLRAPYDQSAPLQHLRSTLKRQPFAVPLREHVDKLLRAAHEDPDTYLMVRLLYSTGIRISELAGLAAADVGGPNGEILIRALKGDQDRYVVTDAETLRLLQLKVQQHLGSVFGKNTEQIHKRLKHYLEATGLYAEYAAQGQKFTAHALRHAFATHVYENGLDFGSVKRLLGHSTWENTLIYTRTAVRDWRAAFHAHHPWGQNAAAQRSRHPMLEELASEFDGELGEAQVTLDTLPLVPSLGDVEALLHSARQDSRDVLTLRLLYSTGARPAELADLRVEDVCWASGGLNIASRVAYLDDLTCQLLRTHVGELPGSSPLLGLNPAEVLAIVTAHAKATGLWARYDGSGRKFSPGALRHAFASHCCDRGMDLFVLRHLLGHRYIGTTARYLWTTTGSWRAQYQQFHPFVKT